MNIHFCILLATVTVFAWQPVVLAYNLSYKDKELSAWVADLRNKSSQPVRDEAKESIRQIGTNALPFLLEELRTLGVLWQNNITNFYSKPEIVERQMRLRATFEVLGSIAKPAIPILRERMNENGFVADTSQHALIQIDPAIAARVLTEALTNKHYYVSCAAANNLFSLNTNAEIAVTVLLKTLRDNSSNTNDSRNLRSFSANALGAIGKQPETIVPVLARVIQDDESPLVRLSAVRALAKFGTNATPALPMLWQVSTNDPQTHVRSSASVAIQTIQK